MGKHSLKLRELVGVRDICMWNGLNVVAVAVSVVVAVAVGVVVVVVAVVP